MKRASLLLALSVILFSSCEKTENFYANQGNAGEVVVAAAPPITAIVNGSYEWSLPVGYAQNRSNGNLMLFFSGDGQKMVVTLSPFGGETTYKLNGRNTVNYEEYRIEFRDILGQVQITNADQKNISGKFSFTVKSIFSDTKYEFTEGAFSIPLQ